jgi:hypothetical protein
VRRFLFSSADRADQLVLEADAALRDISNEYGMDEKK